MGCDGGTIPRRDELVKTKKKAEEKDKAAESVAKWQYCTLSSERLRKPIVSCELGKLYNKEAIIKHLLDKESNEIVSHIRSLKDVKELNLTEKPNYEERSIENGQYVDVMDSPYICPVVGTEMNGKYKFCYLKKCGCVLSDRALREVKTDSCHKCGKPYDESDIIIINGTNDEIEVQRKKMEENRIKEKNDKKSKKRKQETKSEIKQESKDGNPAKIIKKETNNKALLEPSSSKTTKNSTSSLLTEKASESYSVARDVNVSEVYKSIFTSHESAQIKQKAHWVTFNPLYF